MPTALWRNWGPEPRDLAHRRCGGRCRGAASRFRRPALLREIGGCGRHFRPRHGDAERLLRSLMAYLRGEPGARARGAIARTSVRLCGWPRVRLEFLMMSLTSRLDPGR
jgi:hypothetical protein